MERRHDPRHPVRIPVYFDSVNSLLSQSEDISKGGIFVETDASLPIGTPVRLLLHLPVESKNVQVTVEGKVVHRRAAEKGRPAGIGVRFDAFSLEDQRSLLEAFLERLQHERKPDGSHKD